MYLAFPMNDLAPPASSPGPAHILQTRRARSRTWKNPDGGCAFKLILPVFDFIRGRHFDIEAIDRKFCSFLGNENGRRVDHAPILVCLAMLLQVKQIGFEHNFSYPGSVARVVKAIFALDAKLGDDTQLSLWFLKFRLRCAKIKHQCLVKGKSSSLDQREALKQSDSRHDKLRTLPVLP